MIAKANAEAADDGEPGEELQGEEEDNDDAGNYTACPNNSRSAFSKGVHADGDDLQQDYSAAWFLYIWVSCI